MVGGSGKVWNPSRSSEISYAEFSLPRSFVMPFINSYFIMIFESMLFLGCGGGVKVIPAPRPPPRFCLQIPLLSMLFTHFFGSQLFLVNSTERACSLEIAHGKLFN